MFDTGLARIYELTVVTEDGGMPAETLAKKCECFYGLRSISYKRQYEAETANKKVDQVVRVPFDATAEVGMYFADRDDLDTQYRIDGVAPVLVKSNERALELTLIKLEENYDLPTE